MRPACYIPWKCRCSLSQNYPSLFSPSFWGKKDALKRCDMFWQKLCFNAMEPVRPGVCPANVFKSEPHKLSSGLSFPLKWVLLKQMLGSLLFHCKNSQGLISHLPGECLIRLLPWSVFVGVSFCWESFSHQKGEGKGAPTVVQACIPRASYRQLFLSIKPLSLSLFLSYRTTVSAFCSLPVWLVMSPFSFAVPYFPPFPLDWSSLFNLLLYLPNSINSFSEFVFLPHKKPLIVRGECVFAWPLDSCSIQNLSPRVRGIPQFTAFFFAMVKAKRMFNKDLQLVMGVGNGRVT